MELKSLCNICENQRYFVKVNVGTPILYNLIKYEDKIRK